MMKLRAEEITQIIKKQLADYDAKLDVAETGSVLTDCEAQCVAVAVELHAQQLLGVTGGFAFCPDCLARARPINPAPLLDRTNQRVSRAPDESQRSAQLIADDGGPDAAFERLVQ